MRSDFCQSCGNPRLITINGSVCVCAWKAAPVLQPDIHGELDQLRAENAALREALLDIAGYVDADGIDNSKEAYIAREALAKYGAREEKVSAPYGWPCSVCGKTNDGAGEICSHEGEKP